MPVPINVLILDDQSADAELMVRELVRGGFAPKWMRVDDEPAFLSGLESNPDIVLADYRMPKLDAPRAFRLLAGHHPEIPFIVVSGAIGEDIAVAALKLGAADYLLKDRLSRLSAAVTNALREKKLAVEKWRIELALRESEEKFRSIFERAAEGIFQCTPEGELLTANPALDRILGLSQLPSGQKRACIAEICADPARWQECINRVRPSGELHGFPCDFLRPNGDHIWVSLSLHEIRSASDTVIGYEGIMEDITVRKVAEDALRHSEERYRRLFTEDLAALCIATPDGKVEDGNPAFLEMFGFKTLEEARRDGLASLYQSPEAHRAFVEVLEEFRQLRNYETVLRHRDGHTMYVIENAMGLFDENGKLTEVRAYFLDDTEHKVAQQQFLQAQKLEAVARLAGTIAHDLNNLLTVIVGYSDRLVGNLSPGSKEGRDAAEIRSAASRTAKLTGQLLAFSRRQKFELVVLELNKVLSDIAGMIGQMLGPAVSLKTVFDPTNPTVLADASQIEQIVLNLAANARDAMPRGGTFTIQTLRMAETKPGHFRRGDILLSVSDTGCGMDPPTLSRIFEPFFTTKPPGRGTGLGLASVFGIVKQSGGHIDVFSQPDEGTTFKIYLPSAAGSTVHGPASSLTESHGQATILVVEDDDPVRAAVSSLLREASYIVLEARNCSEAHLIRRRFPGPLHLLLADINLPDGDGRHLANEWVCQNPSTAVLFMSGHASDWTEDLPTGSLQGDLLRKPFARATLLEKVSQTLSRAGAAVKVLMIADRPEVQGVVRDILVEAGCRVLEAEDATSAVKLEQDHSPSVIVADLELRGSKGMEVIHKLRPLCPAAKIVALSAVLNPNDHVAAAKLGVDALIGKPIDHDCLVETVRELLAEVLAA